MHRDLAQGQARGPHARVAAQGDLRPMAASKEAMEDLNGILAGRAAFYSKAECQLDTSAHPLEPTLALLHSTALTALGLVDRDMHKTA